MTTTNKRRQDKISEAVSELEERATEIKIEMNYFNLDNNFCPYKVAELIERLEKNNSLLEIVKTLS